MVCTDNLVFGNIGACIRLKANFKHTWPGIYSYCIIQKASSSKSLGMATLIYNMKNDAGHVARGTSLPLCNLFEWHSLSKHGENVSCVWKGLLR